MMIPYSLPGTTTKNITGNWKAFRPVVNGATCIKCGTCQNFCPEGIMGDAKKTPEIDYTYCKGCAMCSVECPVKAITMQREVQ
jgi:2-oxoacid:acceptor oxidoreductase delta subunit (pyruvate/2-ketoisovalerate family)